MMKPSSFLAQCVETGYLSEKKNLDLEIIDRMHQDILDNKCPLSSDARQIVKRLKAATDNGLPIADLKISGYEPKDFSKQIEEKAPDVPA
jgi:hypothetical protein